jgi:cytochrome c biogenesis protein CcdA
LLNVMSNSLISFKPLKVEMLENIAYFSLGFVTVFLALEAAWHFTACKIHDKSIKPCMYKQVKMVLVRT